MEEKERNFTWKLGEFEKFIKHEILMEMDIEEKKLLIGY